MPLQQILKAARLNLTKENGCLILILIGLVVVENFVERDFQCICRRVIGGIFFFFYLFMPAFIVFTVTFCLMCELKRQSNPKVPNQESGEGAEKQWSFKLRCCIPSFFWMLLFLCDGRYVACMATTSKGKYADSTAQPPWEWCNKNRTLTTDQETAETAYIWSKGVGFAVLLLISLVILVYEACRERGASSEQTGTQAEQTPLESVPGTESNGQQTIM